MVGYTRVILYYRFLLMLCLLADWSTQQALGTTADGDQPLEDTILERPFEYRDVYPAINAESAESRVPLYFGLMMSFGGDVKSSGAIPGVQVALDAINDQPDLLPGYTLHYTLTDSQCKRTDALNGLFDQLLQPPGPKIALIGSGCSVATEPTAEVSHYYNITQISCATFSNELIDRQRFRNYFQLLPAEVDIVPIFHAIIKEFKWKKVAIIVQNEDRFTTAMNDLKELLTKANVMYTETPFNSLSELKNLDEENKLFEPGSRIFVVAMFSRSARYLMCLAHKLGMKYPTHLFLTYGTYEFQWWIPPDDEDVHHLCTPEDRAEVLEYSFAALHFNFLNVVEDDMDTDTGNTGEQYLRKYNEKLNKLPFYYTHFDFAPHCYDATWALAKALNKTISDVRERNITLESFSYDSNTIVLNVLKRHLNRTDFTGISGNVAFNENGTRTITRLRVLQYRGLTPSAVNRTNASERIFNLVNVAVLNSSEESESGVMFVDGWSSDSIWNGVTPNDGVPKNAILTVHLSMTCLYSVLVLIGMIFMIVCCLFNLIFRERKLIKLSSPNLNYFIAAGAFVYYVVALVEVLPVSTSWGTVVSCIGKLWLNSFGYSLAIGTILAKIWRVYYIFSNPQLNKNNSVIKDSNLIAFILGLLFIDFVILVVYTALEGALTKFQTLSMPSEETSEKTAGVCTTNMEYWRYIKFEPNIRVVITAILFGYKGLLQLVALYFAFKTRKVQVKGLDDSKYITFVVYIFSVFWIVFIVSAFALLRYTHVFAAVVATSALVCATSLLIIVFVPKMMQLYKDPKGENVFSSNGDTGPVHSQGTTLKIGGGGGSSSTGVHTLTATGNDDALRKRVRDLEDEIQKLKGEARYSITHSGHSKVSFELPTGNSGKY